MEILSGLFDHGVLQRSNQNVCDVKITGSTTASGAVVARVRGGKKLSKAAAGPTKIGVAKGGQLQGRLTGLPVGGPYQVDLQVVDRKGAVLDKLSIKDVLVGDLWIVGGQSNMQGCGRLEHAAKPNRQVRAFYMDDHWQVAVDPLHQLEIAVDPVHNGGVRATVPNPDRIVGVGPAVDFAQEMLRKTKVPQGLLACAHGGTSMTQWDPALKDKGGASYYGASIRRLIKNGGRCAGVIWYQGESDANAAAAALFTQRMKNLTAAFRKDAGDSKLPFVAVQLSHFANVGDSAIWNSIQDQQQKQIDQIKHYSFVPAIDLPLDDAIHVGGDAMALLGRRLAYAMEVIRSGGKKGKPPIRLQGLRLLPGRNGMGCVELTFANVVGQLRAPGGRPSGFTLNDPTPSATLFRVDLDGDKVILRTNRLIDDFGDASVQYGYGFNPFCNVTDDADRGLPAFGPVAIGKSRAVTPFLQAPLVSRYLPGAGKLHGLKHPGDLADLGLAIRPFPDRFCDLHVELAKLSMEDRLIYFACQLQADEAMKLVLCLGYDGPVKAWVDGNELIHDPEGANPAWPDRAKAPFAVEAGSHEILVAFGTNHNKGWGIFLRVERSDVSEADLAAGPEHFRLPKLAAALPVAVR